MTALALGVLERLIGVFLPGLVRMIKDVPENEKTKFVRLLSSLCDAYLEGDRETFDFLLYCADLPEQWRGSLSMAVWGENTD